MMTDKLPEHKKVIVSREEDDDELDPVEEMIKRTGCVDQHNAVQDCIFEHKDWRKCQVEVKEFKACMVKYNQEKLKQAN